MMIFFIYFLHNAERQQAIPCEAWASRTTRLSNIVAGLLAPLHYIEGRSCGRWSSKPVSLIGCSNNLPYENGVDRPSLHHITATAWCCIYSTQRTTSIQSIVFPVVSRVVIVNPHKGGYGLASQTLSPTSGISSRVVLPRCRSLPLWCLSTSSASTLPWIRARVWSNSLRSHSFLAEYFSEPACRSHCVEYPCLFFNIQKAHSTSLLMLTNFVEKWPSG